MDAQKRAIDHMNADHSDIVEVFCKVFGKFENPTNVKLVGINEDGMQIVCDQGEIYVPFLQKANLNGEGFRNEIIALYSKIKMDQKAKHSEGMNHNHSNDKKTDELANFIDSLKTLSISSINAEGFCVSSYAPFIREDDEIYFYTSAVAEHYHSIKANPDRVSLMFIEDEKDAKTILARKRLSSRCLIKFITDERQRDAIFDKLADKNPNETSIADLKNMKDFHIIRATLTSGRYVKGFAAAYNTNGLEVQALQDQYPHTKR
ncbi:HugZ family heme oxygenase [Campylobacter sp. faydin G-24]|uniref:HugZ family heme oxygenase n=1 Tax=Campylobacter anatolicus TaxID=2829105 RepID=A0ABS5HKD7_9BACT|nr:HugZ family heme oxygenase [Campylobacter anatolicus]MBR8464608.1 HugZ family heme oxygenase [Campylobacter anatolicus]